MLEATQADLVIVGAGVAGLTAAAHAARLGLDVLVIERMGAGGQVMTVEHIGNFPDHPDGIAGFDLGPMLQEAAEDAGAAFMLDSVTRVEPVDAGPKNSFLVHCDGGRVAARAVLVAAGSVRRPLQVPGETELEGRGVSHCASCDGPLYRGDAVCVVGGGDSAVGEALVLARHAKQVSLVFQEEALHAQPCLVESLRAQSNVALLPRSTVVAIETDNAGTDARAGAGVGSIRLASPQGASTLPVAGVFIYAGLQPASGFLQGLVQQDEDGRLVCDAAQRTSTQGLYAAGDIRAGVPYSLAAVARDGAAVAAVIAEDLSAQETTA